jgi:hypothetical protein
MIVSSPFAGNSATWAAISIVAFSIVCFAGLGCGEDSGTAAFRSTEVAQSLDRLRLHPTVQEVEDQLGMPESRVTDGPSESVLQYGSWRLYFEDDVLDRRSLEVWLGTEGAGRSSRSLDQAILDLHRGMSAAEVETRVGRPLSYEKVFTKHRDMPDEIVLRYANWQVVFVEGLLNRRTQY